MGIEQTAATSEIFGDLYSVFRCLVDDVRTPSRRVYFDAVGGDNFERPSIQLKIVTFSNTSRTHANKVMNLDVMAKFFAATEFEAIAGAEKIQDILTGWPDRSLPKYDFSVSPPAAISFNGRDQYSRDVPWAAALRIDPNSFKADPFKTEDHNWEVPITFSLQSPRHRNIVTTLITSITYAHLLREIAVPVEASATMKITPTIQP